MRVCEKPDILHQVSSYPVSRVSADATKYLSKVAKMSIMVAMSVLSAS